MDKKREDLCRYRLEKARIYLSSTKLLVQSEDNVVQQIDHIIPFFIVSGVYEIRQMNLIEKGQVHNKRINFSGKNGFRFKETSRTAI